MQNIVVSRIFKSSLIPLLSMLLVSLLLSAVCVSAQQAQPRLVHLEIPVYLPLAIQANVSGAVEMELTITQDGTVKSSKALSGHPLLARAVTDSLGEARFACESCGPEPHTYVVTYEFVLPADRFAKECAEESKTGKEPAMPPSTLDSPYHVTVRASHPGCLIRDPAALWVRSVRCLWLWKCAISKQ